MKAAVSLASDVRNVLMAVLIVELRTYMYTMYTVMSAF